MDIIYGYTGAPTDISRITMNGQELTVHELCLEIVSLQQLADLAKMEAEKAHCRIEMLKSHFEDDRETIKPVHEIKEEGIKEFVAWCRDVVDKEAYEKVGSMAEAGIAAVVAEDYLDSGQLNNA